jgi:hypothetical protein
LRDKETDMKSPMIITLSVGLFYSALPLYGDTIKLVTNASRFGRVTYDCNTEKFTVTSTTNGKPDTPYLIPRIKIKSIDLNDDTNNATEPGTDDQFRVFEKLSALDEKSFNAAKDRILVDTAKEIAYTDNLKMKNSVNEPCHLDIINTDTVYYRVEKANKTSANGSAARTEVATIEIEVKGK